MSSVTSGQSDVFVRVSGRVCEQDVNFLIDSGASHNFVSSHLLNELGVVPHRRAKVRVRLANQSHVVTNEFINVLVQFSADVSALLRFTVLPVDCPTILGMPFLSSLNPAIDWYTKKLSCLGSPTWLVLLIARTCLLVYQQKVQMHSLMWMMWMCSHMSLLLVVGLPSSNRYHQQVQMVCKGN